MEELLELLKEIKEELITQVLMILLQVDILNH
jgi:hypothetical protein